MRPLVTFLRMVAELLLGAFGVAVAACACLFVVATFRSQSHDKSDQVRRVDLPAICETVKLYRSREGRWPATLQTLVDRGSFARLPTDPWDRDYLFDARDGVVCVTSLGRDGDPGGEGQDADLSSCSDEGFEVHAHRR